MGEERPVSKVRARRHEKGLLLVELAKAAKVAVGYLSMIENGYLPKREIRKRLAAALDTTVEELWPEVAL